MSSGMRDMRTAPRGRLVEVELFDGTVAVARWDRDIRSWVTEGGAVLIPKPVGWRPAEEREG